ncbi:hypothetical protein B7R22_02150 [Subtercola boreus]|uniref:Xylose isomerase-like TIM barrel domain-containing protein n=1 Tax=Subtercola boreus TaxID=120213 RepID=A0A3E0W616_9MICO|nr:sugar phosphate isomerase/epimerase [Subtercola boreus]RFA16898.1 hypothetical protein B7R22_02150 [Subtercola boreus]
MPNPSISIQLYTVRDALASDVAGTLARLKAIGYSNVELFGFQDDVETYEAALSFSGLKAPSAHALLLNRDVTPVFEAAQRLGVSTVIDPDIHYSRWTTRDDVETAATELNEISRKAADFGLKVGYHNHSWEVRNRLGSVTALEVFADSLDEAVALEVDTFWVEVGGVSSIELLGRLGERVKFLHVKDGPLSENPDDQVGLGKGEIDVHGIIAAAPHAMRIVELDGTRGGLFGELEDSYAYLRSEATQTS